ncbi:unnamed protein product [Rotaria sordida]|uniref:Alpha-galactosidase n=1 Tax=Rotaria sordida TaxID=392033 RepID=A0A814WRF1_9BILA|nr:unnamed protein product [Rotaria sordida]
MKWTEYVIRCIFVVVSLCSYNHRVNTLDNGLLRQPPMGWLTWQRFRCVTDCQEDPDTCISENLIRTQAQLLVQGGYLAAGYEYIIIDDCWLSTARAPNGSLQPDSKRFPSGIRALADYVHSLGLKLGIYEDYGTETCGGYPGSLGHLEQDAKTFADWTVDYLKLDGCYADIKDFDTGYPAMEHALNATGFPIAFSCSWPAYQEFSKMKPNYTAIAQTCNLWRNWDDIDDSWESVYTILQWFGDNQDRLSPFHGPGHWNDPDMIVVGNYGLSPGQSRAQMALWSIMAAPLILSVDLRTITIAQTCNLWRHWDDIDDSWESVYTILQWFGDNQDRLSPFHGPGHWNDPDMIVVGNYGLSPGQSRAQMALWSIMAAPLILSVDLRTISSWARDIILNKNLIAINQDPLGAMGRRILQLNDHVEIWSKPLLDDRVAFVALYPEPYGTPIHLSVNLTDLGLIRYQDYNFFESFYGSFLGKYHYTDKYNFTINPSGDVHAFYVESATPRKRFHKNLQKI